jgi:hypothetical protein
MGKSTQLKVNGFLPFERVSTGHVRSSFQCVCSSVAAAVITNRGGLQEMVTEGYT